MTADLADPLAPFRDRWAIVTRPAGLSVWTAELTSDDGRTVRYIVAHTAAGLAEKLAAVEAVSEPG
jgi:hypothetical protein